MTNNQTNFSSIFKTTHQLLQIQDIDILLERMLTEIRSLVNADAGSIYLAEGSKLHFSHTQNTTLQKNLPFGKKLIYSTFRLDINNQSIAGYCANTGLTLNIPDVYNIDGYQPYSFDKKFDKKTGYHTKSMLTVPIKSSGEKVIGVVQLINATELDHLIRPFTSTEESIAQLFANNAAIAITHAQMTRSMIMRTNKMIELHDPKETIQHANRVAAYSVEIYETWAHKQGIDIREVQHKRDILRMAAMLHDIGKISVPKHLLEKTEDLTKEEKLIKQKHTVYGARLFDETLSEFEEIAQEIALTHHENWDGSGYPGHVDIKTAMPLSGYEKSKEIAFGKTGAEIPIYGRIVAVANAYDILLHKFDEKGAIDKVISGSGTKFDPDVISAFLGCLEVIKSISTRYTLKPKTL